MNNQIHRTVRGLIRGALILGAGMGSVLAQDAADAASELEEVHVTGSRIQRDGMSTPTPVTVVNMDDLKVLAPTTIGAAVTQLPQFNNSSVPEGAAAGGWTGASGASILNLRGVGQNRTLVLLDGRRVVPSSRRGTLDVNLLPDPLIQRVEVVTGGASAAWGSDAVSGVVNFMLDTKLEGFEIDLQGGLTEIGDNENLSASLSGGLPLGDRAHLIAAVDIYKVKAIKDAFSRDWQDSWGIITNTPAGNCRGRTRAHQALRCPLAPVHRRWAHHHGAVRQPHVQSGWHALAVHRGHRRHGHDPGGRQRRGSFLVQLRDAGQHPGQRIRLPFL